MIVYLDDKEGHPVGKLVTILDDPIRAVVAMRGKPLTVYFLHELIVHNIEHDTMKIQKSGL